MRAHATAARPSFASRAAESCWASCEAVGSMARIASVGHAATHSPQSTQRVVANLILFRSTDIASFGQASTHALQWAFLLRTATQLSCKTTTRRLSKDSATSTKSFTLGMGAPRFRNGSIPASNDGIAAIAPLRRIRRGRIHPCANQALALVFGQSPDHAQEPKPATGASPCLSTPCNA